MGMIVQVDGQEIPWAEYQLRGDLPSEIRVKKMLPQATETPAVQYVEYGPGQTDPVHHHDTGELFLVTEGELWLGERCTGPGGVIYIPADTEYAVRAGEAGARYFRVVTPD
jgi:quercetin dioxygenase-like cupin family protein